MAEFCVETDALKREAQNLNVIIQKLVNEQIQVAGVRLELCLTGNGSEAVKRSLRRSSENLLTITKQTRTCRKVMNQVARQYETTEKKNTETFSGGRAKIERAKNKNPAFDHQGSYGGDQGSPMNHEREMAGIVRKYYPEFTDQQVRNYLTKLNSEGCGYVAITNTIFRQYVGREEEFEKTFGFPMYTKDGELNYDAMVTDFYCATDNHNKSGVLLWQKDSVDLSEDTSDTKGWGTTRASREYRWEMYMKDHGVDVDVHNVSVSPKNYHDIAKNGDIVVNVSPVVLYDANGKEVRNVQNAGHAMTVTGVKGDMYRVSSWGEEYYVKPGSYQVMEFQQVTYKKKGSSAW